MLVAGEVGNKARWCRELRAASSETLMYIKEDLIIPNHLTFNDLIVTQVCVMPYRVPCSWR